MRVGFRPPANHDAENDAVLGASSESIEQSKYSVDILYVSEAPRSLMQRRMEVADERVWSRL